MANRSFNRLQALDKEVKFLFLHAAITDGSGAAELDNSKSVGIKSISRSAEGEYDITLGVPGGDTDKYSSLLFVDGIILDGTAITATGGLGFQIEAETVSSDGVIKIFVLDKEGVRKEVKNGDIMKLMIVVKNSNQPGVGAS
tara:strand:+ start:3599 stop:4024 length:426 start_codon:yes stop_codon:yes gene_type:complete